MIKDRLGQPMYGTNTHHLSASAAHDLAAGETLTYSFSFDAALGVGTYSVATALADSPSHLSRNFEWRDLAAVFQVANLSRPNFVGTAYLAPTHHIQRDVRHA